MTRRAPPLNFPVHIPFVQQLGLELHSLGDGEAEIRVDLQQGHLNSWEVAHGGVLMTLLDVASLMMKRLAASDDSSTPRYDLHMGYDALARHAAQLAARFSSLAADPAAIASMLADIEANRLPRAQYRLGPARRQPGSEASDGG